MNSDLPNQKAPENGDKRQCWECLRRRLVCDGIRPVCNKCKASGMVCPGYEDKKPLVWVTPGKVTSRTRRTKPTASKKERCPLPPEAKAKTLVCLNKAPSVVEKIPRMELRSDAEDIVQAICYYNTSIFPAWKVILKLAPNNWMKPLPLDALHNVDTSLRHSLTLCALEYRMQNMMGSSNDVSTEIDLRPMRTKSLYHRDIAIRALSEAIGDDQTRATDVTIVSVLMFLLIDIRQCAPNWRLHFDGLTSLIELRGGFNEYFRLIPYLKVLIVYYCIVGIIGNTTSPADDLACPEQHAEIIELIREYYEDGLFPTLLAPPALFFIIIRINLLRHQASQTSELAGTLEPQARELMDEVERFSSTDWVCSIPTCGPGLLLVAQIYQSAVMVYCISSLQSVQVLPQSKPIHSIKNEHHRRLMSLLREGLLSTELRASLQKCVMWPLIVAGTEMQMGSIADRTFIERQLEDMCQDIGSSLPRLGVSILKRFWSSDATSWDSCFDRPYAFVT